MIRAIYMRPLVLLVLAALAAGLAAVAALGLVAAPASAATTGVFENASGITINDSEFCFDNQVATAAGTATPYPSGMDVSGLSGSVTDVNVTISGLTHPWPDDIGLLLVSPAGQSAILMTDSGGSAASPVSDINLTFDDEATTAIPDSAQLTSGTSYKPGQGTIADDGGCLAPVSFPDPAPASPYGTTLSVFDGSDPNGAWKLYVIDDTFLAAGAITSWRLDIVSAQTPQCTVTKSAKGTYTQRCVETEDTIQTEATFTTQPCETEDGSSGTQSVILLRDFRVTTTTTTTTVFKGKPEKGKIISGPTTGDPVVTSRVLVAEPSIIGPCEV